MGGRELSSSIRGIDCLVRLDSCVEACAGQGPQRPQTLPFCFLLVLQRRAWWSEEQSSRLHGGRHRQRAGQTLGRGRRDGQEQIRSHGRKRQGPLRKRYECLQEETEGRRCCCRKVLREVKMTMKMTMKMMTSRSLFFPQFPPSLKRPILNQFRRFEYSNQCHHDCFISIASWPIIVTYCFVSQHKQKKNKKKHKIIRKKDTQCITVKHIE